jgi:Zn-dependent protease/CBS domain-containing protein
VKWSFKVVRLWGIDVYVHVTFLLFLALMGLQDWVSGGSLSAALRGVLLLVALFLCVLFHEYGHALAARRYGIKTRDITLLPIGGIARLERLPDDPKQELVVALAGPLVNVIIAAALFAGLLLSGAPLLPGDLAESASPVHLLLFVNVSLVLFNLLPAFPMDGGRVLRALLAMVLEPARATRIAAMVGRFMAVVLAIVAVSFQMWMLLLIAVFVWFGAASEAQAATFRSVMNHVTVARAMLTEFGILSPSDPLAHAEKLILAGSQQDFPVVEDGRVVGVLGRAELFAELARSGNTVPVGSVMNRQVLVVKATDPLETALLRLQEAGVPLAVVEQDGRWVGLLTLENVGEFIAIQQALARRPRVPPVIVARPPRLP